MKKITQEEFDSFKLRVIDKCMKDIKKEDNKRFEFQPSIFLKAFNKTNKHVHLPGELFQNDGGKEVAVNIIRNMVKWSESSMMCFITEGYQASIPSKDADVNNLPRPSQLPEDQRDEVLFMAFESYNLPSYAISFIKTFDKEYKIWSLKPHPLMTSKEANAKGCMAGGTFSNFYNK